MRNIYNCNNCLYKHDCEEDDVDADEGCFNHSHFEENDPNY
jgi:hypothetical protein